MVSEPLPEPDAGGLRRRLSEVGRRLGAREAEHRAALDAARRLAESLRAAVAEGLAGFHAAMERAGAGHVRVELSPARLDDKHVRSVEFELRRGRHRAVVTVKSRGEVTLVGPFKAGKNEGPCRSFPSDAAAELDGALGEFLERFLEEAATP